MGKDLQKGGRKIKKNPEQKKPTWLKKLPQKEKKNEKEKKHKQKENEKHKQTTN